MLAPSESTGKRISDAPAARNAARAPGYPGSSTSAESPGSVSKRVMRSMACWDPLTTMTCSSPQRTARAVRMYDAIACLRGRYPAGSPYVSKPSDRWRHRRAVSRAQILIGNAATSGCPDAKGLAVPWTVSRRTRSRARTSPRRDSLMDREERGTDGSAEFPAVSISSGNEEATHVPASNFRFEIALHQQLLEC